MKIFRSLKQLADHVTWQLGRERQSHQALRQGHARGKPEPDCSHGVLMLTLGDDKCYYWECEDCLIRIPAEDLVELQPGIIEEGKEE